MSGLMPINLKGFITDNRELLKPPVGNKMVWQNAEFMVMVVGGPNQRKDFHIEDGEEFFLRCNSPAQRKRNASHLEEVVRSAGDKQPPVSFYSLSSNLNDGSVF